MIYLPVILILTLTASLIVAFLINPVFATSFMKPEYYPAKEPKKDLFRKNWFWFFVAMSLLMHLSGMHGIGNFFVLMVLLIIFNRFILHDVIHSFQQKVLPWLMSHYENSLRWALYRNRPGWLLAAVFGLFILASVMLFTSISVGRTKTEFFPTGDPPIVYVYLKMPVGTKTSYTDSVTTLLEKKVFSVLGENNPIVESVISNVAVGATDPFGGERGTQANLGRIQISFVEYEKRHGEKTSKYVEDLRKTIKDLPGAEVVLLVSKMVRPQARQ